MIVAQQVKHAMHDQMSGMIGQALALLASFSTDNAAGKNDTAKKAPAMYRPGRKRQYIGGSIRGAQLLEPRLRFPEPAASSFGGALLSHEASCLLH